MEKFPGMEDEEKKEKKKGSNDKYTQNGYRLDEAKSALQKAIRRGDEERAGFFAHEMAESDQEWTLWNRLTTIAAEDCAGMMPLIFAAQARWTANKAYESTMIAVKVAIELSRTKKDRTADDLTVLLGDLPQYFEKPDIRDYEKDCHTKAGRKMGKKGWDFWLGENAGGKLENESEDYDKTYWNKIVEHNKQKYGEPHKE